METTTWTYTPRIHPSRQHQTRTGKDSVATVYLNDHTWIAEVCLPDETHTRECSSEVEAKLYADKVFDAYLLANQTASEIWKETCTAYKEAINGG